MSSKVATAFLEAFFGTWVAYGYTAGLEEELDRIAAGEAGWTGVLRGFWGRFHAALEETGALERGRVLEAIETRLADFLYGPGPEPQRRRCPSCGEGELALRVSRHGPFVGCGAWPGCRGAPAGEYEADGVPQSASRATRAPETGLNWSHGTGIELEHERCRNAYAISTVGEKGC